jgi:hypothetical protein
MYLNPKDWLKAVLIFSYGRLLMRKNEYIKELEILKASILMLDGNNPSQRPRLKASLIDLEIHEVSQTSAGCDMEYRNHLMMIKLLAL